MLQPRFLRCTHGHLHVMAWGRNDWQDADVTRVTLILPPFAEELNKSRHMLARLGHALAEAGGCALLPDLYGTGDSEGRFEDTDWTVWRQDILDIVRHLHDSGIDHLDIVALRMGAMLALTSLPESPLTIGRLVLWQPLLSGKRLLSQFLRLRVMAAKMRGRDESVNKLLARLSGGEPIEVGGYLLNPALAAQLLTVGPDKLPTPGGLRCDWYEVAPEAGRELSKAANRTIVQWRTAGCKVSGVSVEGPAFWETQEIATAPTLIAHTLRELSPK